MNVTHSRMQLKPERLTGQRLCWYGTVFLAWQSFILTSHLLSSKLAGIIPDKPL